MPHESEQELQIRVHGSVVSVRIGALHLTVPTARVSEVARAFNAARILIGAAEHADGAESLAAPAVPEAWPEVPATTAPSLPRGNGPGLDDPSLEGDGLAKPRRRSRKRVGVALSAWLLRNPGWYSEDELLDTVIRERMSDADPHRALKIALGKQRDIFAQDADGRWSLSGGAAPEAPPEEAAPTPVKRGRGRPKGSGLPRIATRPADTAPQKRGPGRPKGSGLKRPRLEGEVKAEPRATAEAAKPARPPRVKARDKAPELDRAQVMSHLFSEPT